MKTEIARFCDLCSQSLRELPASFDAAAARMEVGARALPGSLATLHDLNARLRSLREKLASQQAYLLIFGPLKSGKSTLMNALSGTYVSEVTSLPGYPCLVFVQHAKQPHCSLTRYNGKESIFSNSAGMHEVLAEAHRALAVKIRSAEQAGQSFDPRTHFPDAIRRVDLKLDVPNLAESGTVLVDTPGLYSRMNFGYDVLTREFRDSAACAVFVVKTDNLFLEQVFAEFNQLLGIFSRIFIVVNLDSGKRDLQPDGSLQPSAESAEPQRIIEAFTTLTMAGELRTAYEEGRVRIHAVDLLSAASSFLSPEAAAPDAQRTAFDAFVQDLTEYLNSSDYTREFIRDSLRQAQTLCAEASRLSSHEEVEALRREQERLVDTMRELDEKIAAVDRLLQVDWPATFEKMRADNLRAHEEDARIQSTQLAADLRKALARWFETKDSLKALERVHWNPLMTETALRLATETRTRLRRFSSGPMGGCEPGAASVADLLKAGLDLATFASRATEALNVEEDAAPYLLTVKDGTITVRKTFWDYVFFRSQQAVRRRLFGDQLTAEIDPATKQKRLPELHRAPLLKMIDDVLRDRFPAMPARYSEQLAMAYVARFTESVRNGLRDTKEQLVRERAAKQVPFEINLSIFSALHALEERTQSVATDLQILAHAEQPPESPVSTADAGYLPLPLLPLLVESATAP